ncbi:organic hydroperoxide reductase OsmC/OhrA [Kineosphaera limosa]|uniref:OsmC family protein n=1 Tax=Kineosphaera limosa NBRC 100340 TaxID=1184609 RepID=K6WZF5_9MICO|nr:OsmC family protein [Kineosphaera limosa]NYE00107.1 organic hydroperoxide reductase OsmC/OhrA [Kineosphaera limosa]GAB97502.1 hypothetical protein KILIM_072_00110 [Kineosphaera limosa NBRC 100340]
MATHHYGTSLAWVGSTGLGYEAYDRTHSLQVAPGTSLTASADPAFRGAPDLTNPEALLLAAASSCQCLSFLALAARARLDVTAYSDDATARMPEDDPPTRITDITLRPRITIRRGDADESTVRAKVDRLVGLAHEECFIARTLKARIHLDPRLQWAD